MTRIMYDGVNLGAVPKTGAEMIAFYINGTYAVSSITEVDRLFPGWAQVPIDVNGERADYARAVDVENGDVTPGVLEEYITSFNETNPSYKHGGRPVVYCNRSTIPSVRTGTGKYILGRDYYLWVSTLDGTQFGTAGHDTEAGVTYTTREVVACQYEGYPDYDKSVVYSAQWMA